MTIPAVADLFSDYDEDALEAAMEADRTYFERHPRQSVYIRRYRPGEGITPRGEDPPPFVIVTWLGPDRRARQHFRLTNKCA